MVLFHFMWSKFKNSENSFCDVTLENSTKTSAKFKHSLDNKWCSCKISKVLKIMH